MYIFYYFVMTSIIKLIFFSLPFPRLIVKFCILLDFISLSRVHYVNFYIVHSTRVIRRPLTFFNSRDEVTFDVSD